MINKETYIKEIAQSLALLSQKVALLNAVNLYDINIIAEDFFPGLLNLIYGYELKNIQGNGMWCEPVQKDNLLCAEVEFVQAEAKLCLGF